MQVQEQNKHFEKLAPCDALTNRRFVSASQSFQTLYRSFAPSVHPKQVKCIHPQGALVFARTCIINLERFVRANNPLWASANKDLDVIALLKQIFLTIFDLYLYVHSNSKQSAF